jgi:predicted amidophosphoribosyltransferase
LNKQFYRSRSILVMAVPNLWRTKRQRYSLEAEVCPTCAKAIFPPREICPHCQQSTAGVVANAQPHFHFTLPATTPAAVVAVGGDD